MTEKYINSVDIRKISTEDFRNLISETPIKNKDIILKYLKSFPYYAYTSEPVFDKFSSQQVCDADNAYSDGEYIWYESDIYHFEKYNFNIDSKFVEKILKINNIKYDFMKSVFSVDAYMTDGKFIYSKCVESSRNYIDRYSLPQNKTLLIGRAWEDFTVNDVLFTENNTPIYIEGFHLYGHEMDFIGCGCTCVIICTKTDYRFTENEILKIRS